MALVCSIAEPFCLEKCLIGRFMHDSEYYMAVKRHNYLDFFLYNTENIVKIRSYCMDPFLNGKILRSVSLLHLSNSHEGLLFKFDSIDTNESEVCYWIGGGITSVTTVPKCSEPISSPFLPDYFCFHTVDTAYCYMKSRRLMAYTPSTNINCVGFLDNRTVGIGTAQAFYLVCVPTREVKCEIMDLPPFKTFCYIDPKEPSIILGFSNHSAVLVDSSVYEGRNLHQIELPYSENKVLLGRHPHNGNVVWHSGSKLFEYDADEKRAYVLFDFRDETTISFLSISHFCPSSLPQARGQFEYTVYELEYDKDSWRDIPRKMSTKAFAFDGFSYVYHTLAGTRYGLPKTMSYVTNALTFEPTHSVTFSKATDIFWVSSDQVLATGPQFAKVIDLTTQQEVDTWHKPYFTIYADDTFQVCPVQIYTEDCSIPNPLLSNIKHACRHGDCILIASWNEVAVITPCLELIDSFQESRVYSLFEGGYTTDTGIKFINSSKKSIKMKGVLYAAVSGDILLVSHETNGFLYSLNGKPLQPCELGIGYLNYVYDCGSGIIIESPEELVLLRENKFTSLAGKYEKLLLSSDLKVAVGLTDSILLIKLSIGMQLKQVDLPTSRCLEGSEVIYAQGARLAHHTNNESARNHIHINPINGQSPKTRRLPNHPNFRYKYWLSPNGFLVEFAAYNKCGILSTYNLQSNTPRIDCIDFDYDCAENYLLDDLVRFTGHKVLLSGHLDEAGDKMNSIYVVDSYGGINEEREVNVNQAKRNFGISAYPLGFKPEEHPLDGDRLLSVSSARHPELLRNNTAIIQPKAGEPTIYAYSQSAINSDTYNVARIEPANGGLKIESVGVQGSYEFVDELNDMGFSSVQCLRNKGVKKRYQPDFIASGANGCLYTFTILSKEESKALTEIQKELIGDHSRFQGVAQIEGSILLKALRAKKNFHLFEQRGVDPVVLQKYLMQAFK